MRTLLPTLLAAGAITLPAVAQTQAPQQVTKGQPVAVVYYRCEPAGGGASCEPHKGVRTPPVSLYYVHNGVALEDLPAKDGAWIKHVATYPTVDQAHICSAEAAARATEEVKYCCKGSKDAVVSDNQWKAWALVEKDPIRSYTGAGTTNPTAIMWKLGTETHNGVFVAFTPKGGARITDFKGLQRKGGQGKLEYMHWVNQQQPPVVQGAEAGRIAIDPGDFKLLQGSESGDFEIQKVE